jgi:hypothetical protein
LFSNVAHVDPSDGKSPTRVGYKFLEDGRKVRFAKRSGDVIEDGGQGGAHRRLLAAVAAPRPCMDVAGHEHIAPGRKADPGEAFDWPQLVARLAWPGHCFPPGISVAA